MSRRPKGPARPARCHWRSAQRSPLHELDRMAVSGAVDAAAWSVSVAVQA